MEMLQIIFRFFQNQEFFLTIEWTVDRLISLYLLIMVFLPITHQTRLPKHDGLRMRGIPKTSENPKGAKTRLQIATSKQ